MGNTAINKNNMVDKNEAQMEKLFLESFVSDESIDKIDLKDMNGETANTVEEIANENDNEDHPYASTAKGLNDSIQFYLESVTQEKLLSREEVTAYFKEMEEHPERKKALTEKIILSNTRLVVNVAKKYALSSKSCDLSDLCQVGIMGLYKAINLYDYKMGYAFSTYATWWIRQVIIRELYNFDNIIRYPVHVGEKRVRLERIRKDLYEKLEREPSDQELLKELKKIYPNITDEEVFSIFSIRSMTSLDKKVSKDDSDETVLGDFIVSDEMSVEGTAINNVSGEWLWDMIKSILTAKEYDIIKRRFGYETNNPETLEHIAVDYGITRERIRQIEAKAIKKIKINLRKRGVRHRDALLAIS